MIRFFIHAAVIITAIYFLVPYLPFLNDAICR